LEGQFQNRPQLTSGEDSTQNSFSLPPLAILRRKCRPIPGIFFTATPRAGNRLTDAADLLIADTIDGKPVARYARIRFCEGT